MSLKVLCGLCSVMQMGSIAWGVNFYAYCDFVGVIILRIMLNYLMLTPDGAFK